MVLGQQHSELQGLYKVERSEGDTCRANARGFRKIAARSQSAAPEVQRAGPSAEQTDLGEGWNHIVRGNVLSRPPPLHHQILKPLLSRSRRRPRIIKCTPLGRRLDLRSPSLNLQQPLSWPHERQRRKQPRVSKPRPPNPQPLTWWSPPNIPPSHKMKSLIFSITSPSKHVWS